MEAQASLLHDDGDAADPLLHQTAVAAVVVGGVLVVVALVAVVVFSLRDDDR